MTVENFDQTLAAFKSCTRFGLSRLPLSMEIASRSITAMLVVRDGWRFTLFRAAFPSSSTTRA